MAHIQVRTAPDSELLDATRSGNLDAYGELWNRHAQAAETASRNFAPSLDAQDLVSEAFLKIFRALKAGKGPTDSFRPYMYRVLRSLSADWLQERDPIATSTREPIDAIPDTDTAWPWDDGVLEGEIAVQAFLALDERWKSVLWYTEVEQLPPREVAKLMGISPNGVSKLAARAREGLRFAWIEAHLANKRHAPECERPLRLLLKLQRGRLSTKLSNELQSHLDDCAFCRNAAYELDTAKRRIVPALLLLIVGSGSSTLFLNAFAQATPASAAGLFPPTDGAAGTLVPPEFLTAGDAGVHAVAAATAGATAVGASGSFASAGTAGAKSFLAMLRSPVNAVAAGSATVLGAAGAIAIAAGVFAPTAEETTAAPTPDTSVSVPGNSTSELSAPITDPSALAAKEEHPEPGADPSPTQNDGVEVLDGNTAPPTGTDTHGPDSSGDGDSDGTGTGEKPDPGTDGNEDGGTDGDGDTGGETPNDGYDHSLFPNQLCFFENEGPGSINLAGVASHPGYVKVRITQPPAKHPVELIVANGVTTVTGYGNWWFTEPLNPLEKWDGLAPGDIRNSLVEVQLLTFDGRKSPWKPVTLPVTPPPIETCGLVSVS
ncbi:sigma-70 family RNA polymerase sigma factor [Leucobacter sp. cx-328]|uniref:RNA polymerase sigma factor n=1 Tax=unclassified Leucobacter TaxID=2621730 RepID=UPI00165DBFBF|nr:MULTISPECIES: sigma-70 family RNA polymerase sigma factor [unclassified Leucobacter]MBC9944981.1 sigma-70 family RNA polymerase sigma factor [Leucobacter sp. cx-328]